MRETPMTATQNLPEYSVSELSRALKGTVEDAYSYVRVRGEVSGVKRAGSGHLYLTLKDDAAVIDGVCWRGVAGRLSVQPEDGLEVIATGKLTTYAARSKYQVVIESIELAGEGALLKLLEERRRKLAAEGLFDEERKQPLPFLPEVIGVVTSPTGAIISDILHRLADRFPRHVLLWPVLVQGKAASGQVAAAINGFNGLLAEGDVPRPDLLIVARGGGSLEDLWPFNEESVVRAAAESRIPLISAVGHETDWTLIDHASDRRAPTPTAAAEMAVPVRSDLLAQVLDDSRRMVKSVGRYLGEQRTRLEGLRHGLPDLNSTVRNHEQRLDDLGDRLARAVRIGGELWHQKTANMAARLRSPQRILNDASDRLMREDQAMQTAWSQIARTTQERSTLVGRRLTSASISRKIRDGFIVVDKLEHRAATSANQRLKDAKSDFRRLSDLLESYSFKCVLERGYSVIFDSSAIPVTSVKHLAPNDTVELRFSDGSADAVIVSGKPVEKKRGAPRSDRRQGKLL